MLRVIIIYVVILLGGGRATAKDPVIAITDFEFKGLEKKVANLFVEKVGSDLSSNEKMNVIVHSEVKSVLQEVGLAAGPCDSDSCLIEAARMMDITHVVTGRINKKGSIIATQAFVLDVSTGTRERINTVACWRCNESHLLLSMSETLSDKISANIELSTLNSSLNVHARSKEKSRGIWRNKWTYIGLGTIATGTLATYLLLIKPSSHVGVRNIAILHKVAE